MIKLLRAFKRWGVASALVMLCVMRNAQAEEIPLLVDTYKVDQHAPTLREISYVLYGSIHHAKEIAEWNNLTLTSPLRAGQKLKIYKTPKWSLQQGRKELRALWLRSFNKKAKKMSVKDQFLVEHQEVRKKIDPEELSAEAHFESGQKWIQKKNYKKAIKEFELARKKNPDLAAAWLREIYCYQKLKQYEMAYELTEELIDEKPQMAALPFIKKILEKKKK